MKRYLPFTFIIIIFLYSCQAEKRWYYVNSKQELSHWFPGRRFERIKQKDLGNIKRPNPYGTPIKTNGKIVIGFRDIRSNYSYYFIYGTKDIYDYIELDSLGVLKEYSVTNTSVY